MIAVLRVDPHRVIVGVDLALQHVGEGLAAIIRSRQRRCWHIDPLRIHRIAKDFAIIPMALNFLVAPFPRIAAIGGAEGAAIGTNCGRIQHVGLARAEGDTHPADRGGGKAIAHPCPGIAAIGAAPQAAFLAAADHAPLAPFALEGGGINYVGVARMHGHFHDPGELAGPQQARPCFAAIAGAIQAAFLARPPQRAQRRHINRVAIIGMHKDAAHMPAFLQPHMLPGRAAILRPIDAIAIERAAHIVLLAGAEPDGVGILRVKRYRPHRHAALAFEDGRPACPGIHRLPQAARGAGGIDDALIGGMHGKPRHSPAWHGRADFAPFECLQIVRHQPVRRGGKGSGTEQRGGRCSTGHPEGGLQSISGSGHFGSPQCDAGSLQAVGNQSTEHGAVSGMRDRPHGQPLVFPFRPGERRRNRHPDHAASSVKPGVRS